MKLTEIAERIGGVAEGGGNPEITGIAGLEEAKPGDITFFSSPKYAAAFGKTAASAAVVPRDWEGEAPCPVVRAANPDKAMALCAALLAPEIPKPEPGVHETAVVAEDAEIGEGASVGPYCVVRSGAEIGARTVLGAGCYVGHGAKIGADCVLDPHGVVRHRVKIGDRAMIHDGAVIGGDGFGNYREGGKWHKIPQIGTVEVGDDVEIGSNTTIDRARFGVTRIADGVKIDNLVQIGHNVRIGENTAMAGLVGISGSTEVGANVMLAGQVGVAGHLKIGDGAIVGGKSGIAKDVPPGTFVFGYPALPRKQYAANLLNVSRIPKLKERIAELEQRLAELEARMPPEGTPGGPEPT